MKKILIVVFCALTTVSFGQTDGGGLKAGLNLSRFNRSSSETRIGIHIGGYYQKMVNSNFGLEPELILSLEGDDNISFTNLNLAFGFRYYFMPELTAEIVPQFGFILGDENTNPNSPNIGLGFGLVYMINAKVGVGGRYNVGLTNVYEPVNDPAIKNNTMQFSTYIKLK